MGAASPVRLLLVDDNELFLNGFASLLSEQEALDVVGLARDGREAVLAAKQLRPDVVLMDVNMPVQGGISATRDIVAALPTTRVILLTGLMAGDWAYDPRLVGAHACISKSSGVAEILEVVLAAAAGDEAIARSEMWAGNSRASRSRSPQLEQLTARELEILAMLGNGRHSNEIAMLLKLKHKTIRNYIANIYEKLGVHGRSQAVLHAARNGLLDDVS
jgi:DNA-binding NarL/FixJ family response regulator